MKKIILPLVFISIINYGFSQDSTKQLTEAEKEALRKNHNTGLTFQKKKTTSSQELSTTNSSEEKEEEKTTTVKYYYGTKDTAYKEFKYDKP